MMGWAKGDLTCRGTCRAVGSGRGAAGFEDVGVAGVLRLARRPLVAGRGEDRGVQRRAGEFRGLRRRQQLLYLQRFYLGEPRQPHSAGESEGGGAVEPGEPGVGPAGPFPRSAPTRSLTATPLPVGRLFGNPVLSGRCLDEWIDGGRRNEQLKLCRAILLLAAAE